ncbi:hypothetical protein COT99_02465, partial [Candidatus Falkowbacteria bacterium CG10_big_fil_rev_8_21_14_0_10_43_10]
MPIRKILDYVITHKIAASVTVAVAVVALCAGGFLFLSHNNTGTNSNNAESEGKTGLFYFSLTQPVFAQAAAAGSDVSPQIPRTAVKINKLANLQDFTGDGINLSAAQQAALEEQGLFLTDNNIIGEQTDYGQTDDFVDTYRSFAGSFSPYYRKPQNAIFISSDFALHLYHILADRSFQKIEETKFQPMLTEMARALFLDSINNYNAATDQKLKDSYQRLAVFHLVPLVALNAGSQSAEVSVSPADYETFAQYLDAIAAQKIKNSEGRFSFSLLDKNYAGIELSDDIYETAKRELGLISEAKGVAPSPLFSPLRPEFENDYTQFTPRSHYTKNDVLKSYFVAMMWYGRMGFSLNSAELTRDAILATAQINNIKVNDTTAAAIWADMSATIDFFVGETDDATAYQYTPLIKTVYGDAASINRLADDNLLQQFIAQAVKELPVPRILSEVIDMKNYDSATKDELLKNTLQFRFMGQRFTPDAYILNRLTQGDEAPDLETGQKLPTMPTALMPVSLLNPDNTVVKSYLDEWVNNLERIAQQGRQSDKVIAKVYTQLQSEFAGYGQDVWTKNIYWSWLNCLRPLLSAYADGYPLFMTTPAWQKKSLGTVLGSYTELKHDTLLYAKQSYAEKGGGGDTDIPMPPVVKGYVEPDLTFWNRLSALAEMTQTGLAQRNLMPEDFSYRYKILVESLQFFKDIAGQELANQTISDDDFEKLRTINFSLEQLTEAL